MEKVMIGSSPNNRKRNEWVKKKTGVADITKRITRLKWDFAQPVARIPQNRSNGRIIHWRLREGGKGREIPMMC